ncbi:MAG TPA: hypothetical protein VMU48_09735, partial [Terracidiphilus sp.]|nr:hypothetical protein [Terracidiphilus sp.]
ALMLQGSQANSREKFLQVIANVRNVRDAWKQVARGQKGDPAAQGDPFPDFGGSVATNGESAFRPDQRAGISWTA